MPERPAVRENLTRDDARSRRQVIGEVMTSVHLDLTDDVAFTATTDLTFETVKSAPTFVDLTADEVLAVELDGIPLPMEAISSTRIGLPATEPGEHRLHVVSRMAYQHEGRGLHRFVDPADGRVYLHSQFEPFDAHLVYACFDQPDIKTRFTLSVDAPAQWVVVSNSPAIEQPDDDQAGRWVFATTPLVSPYITAVVAGTYTSTSAVHTRSDGSTVPLGLYVRRSLAEYLDPEEILEVTRNGLDWFEQMFDQPYPFTKYDQLFVPEFSAGAMENPGCITFSETYVFRSKVTDALRERRAETILHEMAHMWFGDLVTMRWWDDLWLNESFATFMAQLAQVSATRWTHSWVTFHDALKTWAKQQDQLPSTHPVAADMPDVESVHQNFDGITYAKGASVLRQLVAWVGQEPFLSACRQYFADHAWDNTELTDFLDALEQASGRDLGSWSDEWLNTTGVNELVPRVTIAADGSYGEVAIEQRAVVPSWSGLPGVAEQPPVLRRHRVAVGVYDRTETGYVRRHRIELDVTGERTLVDDLCGVPAGALLLVNDDDLTYAKIRLDADSAQAITDDLRAVTDPLARTLVWNAAWDMVRDARMAASDYVETVLANLGDEDVIGVLQRIQLRALGAVERYATPANVDSLLRRLADQAGDEVPRAAQGSDGQLAWVRHWASTARAEPAHLAAIRQLLDGELTIDGLELDADLRWHLVISLARAGALDDGAIDDELERDPTDLGERHAATARASRPDSQSKQAAWNRLLHDDGLSHTMSRHIMAGFNQLEQAELLAEYTDAYFTALDSVWRERSLDWAIEFSAAMFPHHAVSDALAQRVVDRLEADLPGPLRRVLLEQYDTLQRTLAARTRDDG